MTIRTPELTAIDYNYDGWGAGNSMWVCERFIRLRWHVPRTATICLKISSCNHRGAWPFEIRDGLMYLEWRDDEMKRLGLSDCMLDPIEDLLVDKLPLNADWSRWYVSVEYTP